jgi:hypothetical protein
LKNRLTIAHGKFLATPNANCCLNLRANENGL